MGERGEGSEMEGKHAEEAEQRSAPGVRIIHEAIRLEGEEELSRTSGALAWSALAAGLSMGFSLITQGLIAQFLPRTQWAPLLVRFGYAVGFLIVILGRQQLFTENTLTVVIPLLMQRSLRMLLNVLRLWGIVLLFNLLGALLVTWLAAQPSALGPQFQDEFTRLGQKAVEGSFGGLLIRGIFAGWLIAIMVWMLPMAETERVLIIIIVSYVIGLGGFPHVVAGSSETMYLIVRGLMPWYRYLLQWMVPTLIGNIIGGVLFVAVVNHAQVVANRKRGDR